MNAFLVELLGLIAGALTTVSFVPQAVKVLRERQTAGVSLAMYLTYAAGSALWVLYGAEILSFAVVLANAITLGLCLLIVVMKLRYG
jgi:MtN3 and saliva related transmembrane protein